MKANITSKAFRKIATVEALSNWLETTSPICTTKLKIPIKLHKCRWFGGTVCNFLKDLKGRVCKFVTLYVLFMFFAARISNPIIKVLCFSNI